MFLESVVLWSEAGGGIELLLRYYFSQHMRRHGLGLRAVVCDRCGRGYSIAASACRQLLVPTGTGKDS